MRPMATGGKRSFNWIVFVVGFGLFSLLWRNIGFVDALLAGVVGVLAVLLARDFLRRGTPT